MLACLHGDRRSLTPRVAPEVNDLHLALFLAYLPHYRPLPGVPDEVEWDPALLNLTLHLERALDRDLDALLASWPTPTAGARGPIARRLRAIVDEAAGRGPEVSTYLAEGAGPREFSQFVTLRSAYHLMEADPHTWAIPRATGRVKAAMVEIQADEYGGGNPESMHQRRFADLMASLDLEPDVLAHLDRIPGVTLATANVITRFALHRTHLPETVGHLAAFEMTSTQPNASYAAGARRIFGERVDARFFDVHVTADAVHEQIAAADMAGGLVAETPEAAAGVIRGAQACLALDARAGRVALHHWRRGSSALL